MTRRAEFIAFVLAAASTALLLLVVVRALDGESPSRTEARGLAGPVYPSGAPAPITEAPDDGPSMRVHPGLIHEGGTRARGMEAAFRLHTWLALRDVLPSGPTLVWDPAEPAADVPDPIAELCFPDRLPAEQILGRDDPQLLGPSIVPRRHLRVFFEVHAEPGSTTLEAHACSPGSGGTSQIFEARSGEEGIALREAMAWLTGIARTEDPAPWFDAWGRPFAPDPGPLREYGEALVESMDGTLPDALVEAGGLLPEASWLSGALAVDPAFKRQRLSRAAAMRPGFTAALEDLAWEWMRAGRPDLAHLTLHRLDRPTDSRPSELLLAARQLEAGAPDDATTLLASLPAPWNQTTAARRLEARARLLAEDYPAARAAARAWTRSDPGTVEGWMVLGDAEAALGRDEAAVNAYGQALAAPSRLRSEVLAHAAVLDLRRGAPKQVIERLFDEDEEPLVLASPTLLALRAWASWEQDDAPRALADNQRLLTLAPSESAARNQCLFTLAAGVSEAPPEACGTERFDDLFGSLMEAVWLSRRPFRTPDEGAQLDAVVAELRAAAPRSPEATGAAVRVLGPRAEDEEEEALQGDFRLSVGATPTPDE